ncbi:hypothetical protein FSP39_005650 [Pinctada imbricata]|uniref:Uncharacterized protein n=1 Tax=Pinctada imbricata TaxID=66713 RepID=A0AA88XVP8_PINIB|nr:hypothetical protein FSP39_005650 [Pinctada imbricata]
MPFEQRFKHEMKYSIVQIVLPNCTQHVTDRFQSKLQLETCDNHNLPRHNISLPLEKMNDKISLAHNGHHHGYPFIDKRSASSMLSINCDTSPQSECCTNIAYETWCEAPTSRAFCAEVNESGREEQCSPTSCSAGQTCYLSVPCKAHYSTACDDSDPCLAFPCDHDGTCINTGINMFTCNCEAGYDASTNCQEEINECDSNPCQNGGTCNDQLNSYSCTCSPGYTGNNCETEINECDSNPCQNGATCTDHVNGYTCTCVDGYKDTNCQTDIDECTSSPCKNGATCNDHVNSYSCTCVDGYGDTNCQTDIDECASDPCQNGASCHDHVNSYSCTCASGFDGSECGTDIDECNSSPCKNGASCVDQVNQYSCTCVSGYNGDDCETDIDECDSNPCHNGGSCDDHVNSYNCTCVAGYIGYNCDTDENDCDSSPCQNGATCNDHVNRYSCTCASGYNGDNCETDINECDSNPCQNVATCHDHVDSYSCTCVPGYTGYNCDTDVNECESNPCQNGATCNDHVNRYSCTCIPGYNGDNCETDINECDSNPCQNGATCHDHVNSYSCTCVPGYTGYNCDTDINECDSNPCLNGATCNNLINKYTCTCAPGYTDYNCQTEINECDSSPCQNGGTCHDHVNMYTCTCVPGFNGVNCQTDINECASNPCINGGSCVDHVNYFTCECTDRYNGTVCEKDCRPGPVDLLFLVDISTSSQTECDRVRSFVSSLVSQIAIGSDDFQVAVISYSFTATLLWDFTQYSNNITLLSAINNISCAGGATFITPQTKMFESDWSLTHRVTNNTGDALELAREPALFTLKVFANNSVGVRSGSAYKQVVLIYDGMSTDRNEAIQESQALAADYIQLYVVGIGHFVDHNELHSLVHDPKYVFSTTDSELLTTILHTTAHMDCTDCVQSTSTDILLLLDSRSREKIKHCIKSGIEMVRFLDIDSTDINMGIYTYSDSIDRKVPIEKNSENQLLLSIPVITLSTSSDENLSRIVSHGKQELDIYGRADSRKILILFSDGQFNDWIDIKNAVQNATDAETTVLIFGAGKTVNHTAIRNVVTDSYYALLSASSDDYTPLQTVKSESRYTVCAEDIFQARV